MKDERLDFQVQDRNRVASDVEEYVEEQGLKPVLGYEARVSGLPSSVADSTRDASEALVRAVNSNYVGVEGKPTSREVMAIEIENGLFHASKLSRELRSLKQNRHITKSLYPRVEALGLGQSPDEAIEDLVGRGLDIGIYLGEDIHREEETDDIRFGTYDASEGEIVLTDEAGQISEIASMLERSTP